MTPKKTQNHPQIFQSRLDNILDMRHKLVKLSQQIDWSAFEKEFGIFYTPGWGWPGLPTRLMAGLTYLDGGFGADRAFDRLDSERGVFRSGVSRTRLPRGDDRSYCEQPPSSFQTFGIEMAETAGGD